VKELVPYFSWWRTTVIRDREIVDAVVEPEHRGSTEFQGALDRWKGRWYWVVDDGDGRIMLIRILKPAKRERWVLHFALFAVTFVTVFYGGALLNEVFVPLPFTADRLQEGLRYLGDALSGSTELAAARDFALGLMAILLAHETGHYVVAKYYKINASPPYFLPAPWPVNFVGTFGAFIRLRSPIVDRRQLLDVGAAGPWAGFVVAVLALVVGLQHSSVTSIQGATEQFIVIGADLHLFLGNSALLVGLRELLIGEGTVHLSPLAFAGWVGVLVTMLNLLPLGQLDGGHVVYALFGEKQRVIGTAVWLSLLGLGFLPGQWWWWIWAILILLLGRGRLGHPQVLDRHRELPRSRRPLGWVTALLFFATFTPVPIHY
jgi:Zn-dependent protease